MIPMMTSISPSPIERGGKMKWKLAVSANWILERVSASIPIRHRRMQLDEAPALGDRVENATTADKVRDDAGPAGLVRGSDALARVAMEVLVEQQQVVPLRIRLELLDRAVDGAATLGVGKPCRDEPAGQV